ncbi:MAG: amylo-alpha-1,6-glucosidase [Leptospirales bacterium]
MCWPEVVSSDLFIDRCYRQAIEDLRILCTPAREGLVPYAGLPWFATVFGRDSLITGLSTLWAYPALSRTILLFLGRLQSRRTDPYRAAEPGKILHEMRTGEMCNTNEIPFGRYYGSVDSTPLYLILAAQYLDRTGDYPFLEKLWPVIERAFSWIERYGVDPRTGFLVYRGDTNGGLVQQGWKDSEDSVFHANGELASHPIALAEVQSYLYWAYDSFAAIASRLGHSSFSNSCQTLAVRLRKSFLNAFWIPEMKIFALALDGEMKPCRVRSSNAGHVLLSGLVSPRMAALLGKSLMEKDLFSGWGIRTLGNKEIRFNPVSYHNGSVWPHDNAMILWGMSRHGLLRPVEELSEGFLDGLRYFRDQRPPELYCGFDRKEGEGPFAYPTSCSPQAWSVASLFMLIQSLGGFRFENGALIEGKPVLPRSLSVLQAKNVPVFGSEKSFVNVSVHRSGQKIEASFS